MERVINKVKLYIKDTDKAHNAELVLKNELTKHNFELNEDADMIISVGGDGTFLKMLHKYNFNNCYYASVNAGSLGFLSSVDNSNIIEFINDLDTNNYDVREFNILKTVIYLNNTKKEYYSLNEFTIRNSDFQTFKADLLIDDKLIEKYNGDGLVISTPIGSTAYNYALNGPILDSDANAFILTPIVPINNKVYHALSNSLVLSNNKKITIIPNKNPNLCILVDGKIERIIPDRVDCYIENKIKVIVPKNYNYLNIIKNKIIDTKEE